MGDESTCTSENCKNTENDKVISAHIPSRLCAPGKGSPLINKETVSESLEERFLSSSPTVVGTADLSRLGYRCWM